MTKIEDFPFTTILAFIGALIGLMLSSSDSDISTNFNYSQISEDPTGFLTGYVVGIPTTMLVETIFGLIGGTNWCTYRTYHRYVKRDFQFCLDVRIKGYII